MPGQKVEEEKKEQDQPLSPAQEPPAVDVDAIDLWDSCKFNLTDSLVGIEKDREK